MVMLRSGSRMCHFSRTDSWSLAFHLWSYFKLVLCACLLFLCLAMSRCFEDDHFCMQLFASLSRCRMIPTSCCLYPASPVVVA